MLQQEEKKISLVSKKREQIHYICLGVDMSSQTASHELLVCLKEQMWMALKTSENTHWTKAVTSHYHPDVVDFYNN